MVEIGDKKFRLLSSEEFGREERSAELTFRNKVRPQKGYIPTVLWRRVDP